MSDIRDAARAVLLQDVPHFDTCAGLRGPRTCDCGVIRAVDAYDIALAALAQPDRSVTAAPLDVDLPDPGDYWYIEARKLEWRLE